MVTKRKTVTWRRVDGGRQQPSPGDLVKLVRRSGGGALAPLVRWEDAQALERDRWSDEFPIDHPAVFLRFDGLAADGRRVAWILIEGRIGWIEASYLAPM